MYALGLIGVGVMGQNLTLNMERNGFPVAVFDRDAAKVRTFLEGKAHGKNIAGADDVGKFVALLERPRKIVLLVNAGKPVDDVIAALRPHLAQGDVVLDGGNSFFQDTERRGASLATDGVLFIGSGVSGGEEGALRGPAIMPGGPIEAYRLVEPVLTAIAAKVGKDPCCAYVGPRGAGHYVKMVHNGIEYAIMQLIGEAYDLMATGLAMPAAVIGDVFAEWNHTVFPSYLFEITAKVLARRDEITGQPLVDLILDTAEQKGTGKWTSQNAFDLGVPIPTINAAVESRILSGYKTERVAASKVLRGPGRVAPGELSTNSIRDALYGSIIASYAQGMALLTAASKEYGYGLNLDSVASLWRGGCIIRAHILTPIMDAYRGNPTLPNLMIDPFFAGELDARHAGWRTAVRMAVGAGIPVLATGASLSYLDAYRRERLPANLLQGQRDFFGAHTYKRIDRDGTFHTEWND
jgi:6-phosphogluconate dehydrogenase